jgi:8-oxo-dGTP pyrophosphatase MutT (NUDIX family)
MTVSIRKLDKPVRVWFEGESADFGIELAEAVQIHWNRIIEVSPHFTNGKLFACHEIRETEQEITIFTRQTNYAHYLYSKDRGGAPSISSMFVSSLIKTVDGQLLFGRMSSRTSRPGIWQFAGGSLDSCDLDGHEFDLERAIKREIREETGLDLDALGRKVSLSPKYLKQNGNTGIFFEVFLPMASDEILSVFREHGRQIRQSGQAAEFSEIHFVPLHLLGNAHLLLPGGNIRPYLSPMFELELKEAKPSR